MNRIGKDSRIKNKSFKRNEEYFKYINRHPEIDILSVRYAKGEIYMTYVVRRKTTNKKKFIDHGEVNKLIQIKDNDQNLSRRSVRTTEKFQKIGRKKLKFVKN